MKLTEADMANITDYVDWRGDVTLSASPFNDIDALILTQLSMVDLSGIVPSDPTDGYISLSDAAELYFADKKRKTEAVSVIIPSETYVLFGKLATSKRFGNMKLTAHVSRTDTEREKQFAALTVKPGDGSTFVAFRGTDDTIVGWKEDFNMAFMPTIPSQTEAAEYLDRVGRKVYGKIRVGGHSKGGNLAVYAAVKCSPRIRRRIVTVYNYDAPGFSREFLALPEYGELGDRLKTMVPQSSLVGMLLENDGRYSVMKSVESGIMQHNAFSWEVKGTEFIMLKELTKESRDMTLVISGWLSKLDIDSRKKFVDAVYSILVATKATTVTELNDDKYAILRALRDTDKETRRMVLKTFGLLFGEGGKQIAGYVTGSLFKSKETNKADKNIKDRKEKNDDQGNRVERIRTRKGK